MSVHFFLTLSIWALLYKLAFEMIHLLSPVLMAYHYIPSKRIIILNPRRLRHAGHKKL